MASEEQKLYRLLFMVLFCLFGVFFGGLWDLTDVVTMNNFSNVLHFWTTGIQVCNEMSFHFRWSISLRTFCAIIILITTLTDTKSCSHTKSVLYSVLSTIWPSHIGLIPKSMFNTNQCHNGNSEVFTKDTWRIFKKKQTLDKDQSQFDQITSVETRGSFSFCAKTRAAACENSQLWRFSVLLC